LAEAMMKAPARAFRLDFEMGCRSRVCTKHLWRVQPRPRVTEASGYQTWDCRVCAPEIRPYPCAGLIKERDQA
jgi:hypothetical protein